MVVLREDEKYTLSRTGEVIYFYGAHFYVSMIGRSTLGPQLGAHKLSNIYTFPNDTTWEWTVVLLLSNGKEDAGERQQALPKAVIDRQIGKSRRMRILCVSSAQIAMNRWVMYYTNIRHGRCDICMSMLSSSQCANLRGGCVAMVLP